MDHLCVLEAFFNLLSSLFTRDRSAGLQVFGSNGSIKNKLPLKYEKKILFKTTPETRQVRRCGFVNSGRVVQWQRNISGMPVFLLILKALHTLFSVMKSGGNAQGASFSESFLHLLPLQWPNVFWSLLSTAEPCAEEMLMRV